MKHLKIIKETTINYDDKIIERYWLYEVMNGYDHAVYVNDSKDRVIKYAESYQKLEPKEEVWNNLPNEVINELTERI